MSSFLTMSPPVPTHRVSRWRPWLILFGIGVAWKVVVFTLGAAMPRWMVGDGIAHLPHGVQRYARSAQALALPLWNLPIWNVPIERFGLVRAVRVLRVETVRVQTPTDSVAGASCGNLQATVRAYTYFGIPYGEARTLCDTAILQSRLFRRHR